MATAAALRRAALLVSGGLGGAALAASSDEGTRRSLVFNATMVPIYAHYRLTQLLTAGLPDDDQTRAFERLHDRYAQQPLELCLELKGFYVKLGQLFSSFGDDLLPRQYVDALRVLQADAPSQPPAAVRAIVEAELKAPLEAVFDRFDPEPLGAASIGQVHAARLRTSGAEVVVKVQYPDAERFFRNDVATLRRFLRWVAPEQMGVVDAVERQFATEFDYRGEAVHMRRAATSLLPRFGARIAVPLPIDGEHPHSPTKAGLCTRRVLVMEKLEGRSLLDVHKDLVKSLAAARDEDPVALERELRARVRAGDVAGFAAPSALGLAAYTHWLRARDSLRNVVALAYNATWASAVPGAAAVPYTRTPPPPNTPRLLDTLFEVVFWQIFEDGFFHGDLHPGNLVLCDDGRLGLLDWGQAQEIGEERQRQLARLLVALADRDRLLSAELFADTGFRTKSMNSYCLDKWATWRFSRMTGDVIAELGGVALFMENLHRLDPVEADPEDMVMAFRACALLRGNAMTLGDLQCDSARRWRARAVRWLRARGEKPPHTCPGRGPGFRPNATLTALETCHDCAEENALDELALAPPVS